MVPVSRNNVAFRRFAKVTELLQMMLAFLNDNQDLATLARTSQAFKEEALNALWSELDSLKPLLLLLSPLEQERPRVWNFIEPRITLQKWNTYAEYSSRVKSITNLFDDDGHVFASSIFVAIGHTRPNHLHLLPHLRSLRIQLTSQTVMTCIPFLGKSLSNLALWIDADPSDSQFLFQEILVRAPMLQKFTMENQFEGDDTLESLLNLLLRLQDIKEIVLPSSNLTSATLTALSHIQTLQTIKMDYDSDGTLDFRPFRLSPFHNLLSLHLGIPLEGMLPFMMEADWAPKLTRLEIDSPYTNGEILEPFCLALARSVPNITILVLDLADGSVGQQSPPVTFQALQPLLECSQISEFFIRHCFYIPLELEDLECILLKWPNLVSFHFCLEPTIPNDFGFSLDVFHLFARLCPQIESLGLRFKNFDIAAWPMGFQLKALTRLHYDSPIPKAPNDFAMVLACICPSSLTFGSGEHSYGPSAPGPNDYEFFLDAEDLQELFRGCCAIRQGAVSQLTRENQGLRRELEEKEMRILELQRELESERHNSREAEQTLRGQAGSSSRRRSTRRAERGGEE